MVKKQAVLGLERAGNQKKASRRAAGPAVSVVLSHFMFPRRKTALRLIPRMLGDSHAKSFGQSATPLTQLKPLID